MAEPCCANRDKHLPCPLAEQRRKPATRTAVQTGEPTGQGHGGRRPAVLAASPVTREESCSTTSQAQ